MSNSCDPVDSSPLGFSVHGIFQARILEWVAISSSRGSFWPRNWIYVFCIDRWILYHWVTWEAQFLFLWYFMSYPFLTRSSWDHGHLDPKAIFLRVHLDKLSPGLIHALNLFKNLWKPTLNRVLDCQTGSLSRRHHCGRNPWICKTPVSGEDTT